MLNEKEKAYYNQVKADMDDSTAAASLNNLSDYLERYYGKKVVILLDEYDTPMQEAYTEVIGKKWFLLPAIFLIIHLRQILI